MITFNVFGTLIALKVGDKRGVFRLIQEELKTKYENMFSMNFIEDFVTIRMGAEELARTNYLTDEKQEISLEEIYETMRLSYKFSRDMEKILIGLEETILIDSACLINKNFDIFQRISNQGEKIVLICETYYSDRVFEIIFEKVCPELLKYEYISSYKKKKNKISAALYQIISYEKKESFDTWVYYGTSDKKDAIIPQNLGIKTVTLCEPKLKQFQKEILNIKSSLIFQKYIGSSKMACEECNNDFFEKLGCDYGGALYFPYVHWIIQKCQEEKINRLYFISRDGYILKKIADIIIRKKVLPISTYYIYGSRKAWRMSSFSKENCDISKFLFNSSETELRSVKEIAKVLQVPLSFFSPYISDKYILDENLSVEKYDMVRRLIINNKKLIDELISKNIQNREILKRYIIQEIDFRDDKFAFVDLTGSGFTQECLSDVIGEVYNKPIKCFFQKLDWVPHNDKCIFYSFLIGNYNNYKIVEALCRAPHPSIIGYHKENGKIVPTWDSELSPISLKEINSFIKGIELFTNFHVENNMVCNSETSDLTIEYLKNIIQPEIIECLGEMDFQLSITDKEGKKYAPALTCEDIKKLYIKRDRSRHLIKLYKGKQYLESEPIKKYYNGNSYELSLYRSSEEVKQLQKELSQQPIVEHKNLAEVIEQKKIMISGFDETMEMDAGVLICIDSNDIEEAWDIAQKCIESGVESNMIYWTPNGIKK